MRIDNNQRQSTMIGFWLFALLGCWTPAQSQSLKVSQHLALMDIYDTLCTIYFCLWLAVVSAGCSVQLHDVCSI
jgi:hypothetical protein